MRGEEEMHSTSFKRKIALLVSNQLQTWFTSELAVAHVEHSEIGQQAQAGGNRAYAGE